MFPLYWLWHRLVVSLCLHKLSCLVLLVTRSSGIDYTIKVVQLVCRVVWSCGVPLMGVLQVGIVIWVWCWLSWPHDYARSFVLLLSCLALELLPVLFLPRLSLLVHGVLHGILLIGLNRVASLFCCGFFFCHFLI